MRQQDKSEKKRESGVPGGGSGRKDDVGRSGVYPMSGPHPAGDAPLVTPAAWGQGKRGAAGYADHGESEITMSDVTPEKCRDIMTKDPVCCLAGDPIGTAAQMMREHDIGVLPVVSTQDDKKLIGIVTDRDLAIRATALERDPQQATVEQVMSRPVVTCSPDDDYQRALELMEQHMVRRIPQVDNSGRVVGIISQADVALRVRDQAKTAEVVTEISRPLRLAS
jgi:CBS domain-containing protein